VKGALAVSLLFALAGCADPDPGGQRVLLIGIDGATLRVASPLMQQGRLPVLRGIGEVGVAGPLRSHQPLVSPRIWTSIATGKLPEKHGILSFAREMEGSSEVKLYLGSDRKVHALWNMVSDAGMSVGVVNWWNTYPPDRIRGVIVSDHLLPSEVRGRRLLTRAAAPEAAPLIHPPEWTERVAAVLGDESPLTEISDPFSDAASFPDWAKPGRLSEHYRIDETLVRIALEVEARLHPDLLMLFLPGIDRISHVLWGALEERTAKGTPWTPRQREAAAEALRRYYEYTDALIGVLVERYGRDDLVMVVSDHGFEAGSALGGTTGMHTSARALRGVIFARGRRIQPPPERDPVSVNDVTPTILAWLGLPVATDMDGKVPSFLVGGAAGEVASYDTRPVERTTAAPSGAEQAIVEQLRSLGYLEAHDAP
jgi:predicted AlkP superfamily phosphohydrolase/phosphomutase